MSQQKSSQQAPKHIPFESEIPPKRSRVKWNVTIAINISLSLAGCIVFFWSLFAQEQPGSHLSQEKPPSKSVMAAELDRLYAIGYGKTRDAAIGDAQKIVLLQAYGVFVSAKTEVQGFVLVKDQISANAEGFISEMEILESVSPEQSKSEFWKVKICCKINQPKIFNTFESQSDIKALLQKDLVIMIPQQIEDEKLQAAYKQLAGKLEEYFLHRNFKLKVPKIALADYQTVMDGLATDIPSRIFEAIQDIPTDFIIALQLGQTERQGKQLLKAGIVARNRVGDIFATAIRDYPVPALQTKGDWEDAVDRNANALAEIVYQMLLAKISDVPLSKEYRIDFIGYNPETYDQIQTIMEKLPGIHIRKENIFRGKSFMKIPFIMNEDPRIALQSSLEQQNINWDWYGLQNWFMVMNPPAFPIFGWRITTARIIGLIALLLAGLIALLRYLKTRQMKKTAENGTGADVAKNRKTRQMKKTTENGTGADDVAKIEKLDK